MSGYPLVNRAFSLTGSIEASLNRQNLKYFKLSSDTKTLSAYSVMDKTYASASVRALDLFRGDIL